MRQSKPIREVVSAIQRFDPRNRRLELAVDACGLDHPRVTALKAPGEMLLAGRLFPR
jgi:hypothetical protein